jgi:hypothetical protein
MSDELDPRLVQAIRADAYRLPVTVTADELRRRLEADRRQRTGWGWLGAVAAAAVIAVVAVSAWSPSPQPPLSGATPTAGTATVLVAPASPAPSDPALSAPVPTEAPATVPPTAALGDIHLSVIGHAPECRSEGGCGYFLELAGEGRRDRVELVAALQPVPAPNDPVTRYELDLDRAIDPLRAGTYSVTLTSFRYTAVLSSGEPPDALLTASCSTLFGDQGPASIVIVASFSRSECTASIKYVVLAGQLQYRLACGPIEPTQCRELADRAVEAAVLRYPGAWPVSLEFSSVVGDNTLMLDNGIAISLIID